MNKNHRKLINISISYENYNTLRELGKTKDSFNDVLSRILKKEQHDGNRVVPNPPCSYKSKEEVKSHV